MNPWATRLFFATLALSADLIRARDLPEAPGPEDPIVARYLAASQAAVAKVEKEHPAECQSVRIRLQKIHAGFVKRLIDTKGIWPQIPRDVKQADRNQWWMQLLKPYGVEESVWDGDPPFMVTPFTKPLLNAYRWGTQPWVITTCEIQGVTFMIRADGSIIGDTYNMGNDLVPSDIPRPSAFRSPGNPHPKLPEALLQAVGKENSPDWYLQTR